MRDSGISKIAEHDDRMANAPWVHVQMVRRPSPAQLAVEAWGSM